ncbi:MAG: translation initiation factor IF-2 [Lachnospiraceae bacterium]|nr:translation initiation factor IF-2 [Lachnospiraceae bacterium]
MSKIRVYDLVKEINKENGTEMKSGELLEFLKGKGVEVKTASSSVEQDVAQMAKDAFASAAKGGNNGSQPKEETAKEKKDAAAEKPEAAKEAPKAEKTGKETDSVPEKESKPAEADAPKKKEKYFKKEVLDENGNKQVIYFKEVIDENGNKKMVRVKLKKKEKTEGKSDSSNGSREKRQGADQENRSNDRGNDRGRNGDNRNRNNDRGRNGDNRNRNNERGGKGYDNRNNDRGRNGDNRGNDRNGRGDRSYNKDGDNRSYNRDNRNSRRGDNHIDQAINSLETLEKPSSKKKKGDKQKDLDKYDKKYQEETLEYENQSKGGKKKKKGQKPEPELKRPEPKKKEEDTIKTVELPETLTIQELAERIKIVPSALIKKLFLEGKMVTMNQELTFDEAAEIALEYNYIAELEEKVDVIAEMLKEEEEDEKLMSERPPVVCVMGHVDHGKTSLLDAIRSSNVTGDEAGGITQHIGASVVKVGDKKITFLDTPGHEAFTAMRMRGAQATDIAILVVAADDGVMPQTVEAINHAKAAEIEIIVAVNKIDKESANVERVKQELMEYGLVAEEWGGSTIFCPVSAHTKEGIQNLLEMVLLTAEILELKANKNRKARGVVIEALLDKTKGPVATVLVQKGTLRVGDCIVAANAYGKVRAMVDDKGKKVSKAGPSKPVKLIGLNDVPMAGEVFVSPQTEKEARTMAETYKAVGREKMLADTKTRLSLDDLYEQIQAGNVKELDLVIKADVQGSVEAVKQSLMKLSNEEVVIKVIHGGVGAINESDVVLASASNAIIIGFNVRPDAMAKSMAEQEQVDIRLYSVIYNAIEDIESAMKGMLDPIFEEQVIGHLEVRQTYKASGVGTIAGSYVLDGMIQRNATVRITRDEEQIFEGPLASLKRFKDDAKEVKAGYECGVVFENFNDIKEGDRIEAYVMVEVPRK